MTAKTYPAKLGDSHRAAIAKAAKKIVIERGAHSFGTGYCVMELVSKFSVLGRSNYKTDHPSHADTYYTQLMIGINDMVDGDNRQVLGELVPWLVSSATTPDKSQKRLTMLLAAGVRRIASKLSTPGLCKKVCPISTLVAKGDTQSSTWNIEKALKKVTSLYRMDKINSDDEALLYKLQQILTGGTVSGCTANLAGRIANPSNLEEERENLRWFIDTTIDIMRKTQ